ncbi:hypothetical protein [Frankia sp. R43]|uniref:hypothetical protein n=1 Tax=Frankia sp. R43 TaxID=269536 RepID=UPI000AFEFE6F|nr:hypothetical protein [Frankia sp. R43]
MIPVESKIRTVSSVLAGEVMVMEAAQRNLVPDTSVLKGKQAFLEPGNQGLAAGGLGRASSREETLAAEVEELKTALGEAHIEIRVWKKSVAPAGPYADIEVIRLDAGMSTARFCRLPDIPRCSYALFQARQRVGAPAGKSPWPALSWTPWSRPQRSTPRTGRRWDTGRST